MLTRFRALLIIISLVAGCPMHSGRSAVEACVDLGQRPADLVECSVSPCVKQVAADYAGWCALMDGGDEQCWGLGLPLEKWTAETMLQRLPWQT